MISEGLSDLALQSDDTLIQHNTRDDLAVVDKNHHDFLAVTTD